MSSRVVAVELRGRGQATQSQIICVLCSQNSYLKWKGYPVDTYGMSSRVVAVELRGHGQATQAQEFPGMLDEADVTWGQELFRRFR